MNLKSREQLQKLYAKLDPDRETSSTVRAEYGHRETATVLKELGFNNVRAYDSSWLSYGNTFGTAPAEDVTFVNVSLLQSKLNAMQKRVEKLEQELAQGKAAK